MYNRVNVYCMCTVPVCIYSSNNVYVHILEVHIYIYIDKRIHNVEYVPIVPIYYLYIYGQYIYENGIY